MVSDCFRSQAVEAMEKLAPVIVSDVPATMGALRIAKERDR